MTQRSSQKQEPIKIPQKELWTKRLTDLEIVRRAAIESPLVEVEAVVEGNNRVLLKFESQQLIKSFKIRGATYAMASDLESLRRRGIVADSGGNHAQAVALAGRELGVPVQVVMASVVPENKKRATQGFGATDGSFTLDTTPESFVDAKIKAKSIAGLDEHGRPPVDSDNYPKYLSPYDDPAIVRGTATIVPELVGQLEKANLAMPDAVHIPIGGGGLISGIADVNLEQGHLFDLYGHGLTSADSAARSLRAARTHDSPSPTPVEGDPNVIAEGLAVKVIGEEGYKRIKEGKIDDIYTSELADVGEAYEWFIANVLPQLGVDTNNEEAVWDSLPEHSSMVALAGMFRHIRETDAHDKTHLVLISGANIDRVKIHKAMEAYKAAKRDRAATS